MYLGQVEPDVRLWDDDCFLQHNTDATCFCVCTHINCRCFMNILLLY